MTKTASLRNSLRKGKSSVKHFSAVQINEGGQEYILYMMVPGMQRTDFSVLIDDHLLTVKVARREALHCYSNESDNKATWVQSFTLPDNADTLLTAAEYRNGELQIHIPKRENALYKNAVEVFVY